MKALDVRRFSVCDNRGAKSHRRHCSLASVVFHFPRNFIEVVDDFDAVAVCDKEERQQVTLRDCGHEQFLWIPQVRVTTEGLRS